MDLGRVGLEGRKISQIRKYVFRCIGCKFIDKTASKVFCPSCGHRTMRRVACEVQPDGTLKLFLAKNPKVLSSRGTKYALPNPKVIFKIAHLCRKLCFRVVNTQIIQF